MVSTNSVDGIILSVNKHDTSPLGLILTIQNNLSTTIYLNPHYRLGKFSDGNWLSVEPITGVTDAQDDWRLSIYSGTEEIVEYNWSWCYGELSPGEYRIVVPILISGRIDSPFTYNIPSEFSIP